MHVNHRQIDQKTKIGDYGEKLVFKELSKTGKVAWSLDPFDPEKDMTYNGHSIEVKTFTRVYSYPFRETFCIEKNQWRKIDRVKGTIFVSVPLNEGETTKIFYLKDKKDFKLGKFHDYDEEKRFYPIANMQLLREIEDDTINKELFDLSASKHKKKKNGK